MKTTITTITAILISICISSNMFAQPTYDESFHGLNSRYVLCDLTGNETEYVVPLSFHSGKTIDEEIYKIIKSEFDSIMQAAFDNFWEQKYIEYELTRGQIEYEKKQTQIQLARIELLEAQFEYNKAIDVAIDSVLLKEYCELTDMNNMWFRRYDYCFEADEKQTILDTTKVLFHYNRNNE